MLLFFPEVTPISTSFPSSRAMAPQQQLLLTPVLLRLWKGLNPDVSALLRSLLSSFSELICLLLVSGLSWPWAKLLWTRKCHFPPCSGLREPKGIQVVFETLPSIKGCSLQRREGPGTPVSSCSLPEALVARTKPDSFSKPWFSGTDRGPTNRCVVASVGSLQNI